MNPSACINNNSQAKIWHRSISSYTSVQQYQVENASPGTHCLQDAPLISPPTPRQQAMKPTPVIYQPSWMGCLLLQHSKGVTEGESNRGKDGGAVGAVVGERN